MQTPSFVDEHASLDLRQRLVRVFYAPRQTFAAVRAAPSWHDWFVPVVLVCLLGAASHRLTAPVLLDPQSPANQAQLQAIPEAERQKALESMQWYRDQGWIMVFIGSFTSLLAVGGVLYGLARWLFQSQATFQQALIVKGYASLVVGVEWVVRTPLVLLRGGRSLHLGPGALMPEEWAHSLLGQILIGISLFDLWQVWLLALGLAAIAGASVRRAAWALLLLWGLWIIGMAGAEMAGRGAAKPMAPSEAAPAPSSAPAAPAVAPESTP